MQLIVCASQFTLKTFQVSVLLLEDFDHGLEVADVYRLAEDAFRVVVCDDFPDARQECMVHRAIGVELGSARWERTVKRPTHDGSPAIFQAPP